MSDSNKARPAQGAAGPAAEERQQARRLMLGNEAFARGAYEAGCKVAAAYPGTPSTEIAECVAHYKDVIYAEWSPNEKVAMEVASGAALAGVRALTSMKHVGLNVAADPLFTMSYIGVSGGMVVIVADDPGMYSSQNEQDTRLIARAAHVPVLEPADSQEAKDFVKLAFRLSEDYDTPVIVRSTTRLSHSQSFVRLDERIEPEDKPYVKDIAKTVMTPGNAIRRHPLVEARELRLAEEGCALCYESGGASLRLNRVELRDRKIGVISSGIPYQYVREALPEASVLKLGQVHPLPRRLIEDFAAQVETLFIVEELEPFIEEQVRSWGITCEGKNRLTVQGEYSANLLRRALLGETPRLAEPAKIPSRPPILCPGCPHRAVYSVMKKLRLHGAGDIGCYTLGAAPPLEVVDTTICMGASISSLHGMEKARGRDYIKDWVAVIGDSTFMHTGVNSLMNMVYNGSTGTVLILDNSITAMTGHQQNLSTGKTLMGTPAPVINIKRLCEGMGIEHVYEIYSFDLRGLERLFREAREREAVTVIIAQSQCVLLKDNPPIRHQYRVEPEECRACGLCMKPGCPALTRDAAGKTLINDAMCNGCGLCFRLCPFGAIQMVDSVIDAI